jgi:nucleotide-binding universal stress UspA family protein
MRQLKKFLCPTDFSETALEALRYAVDLARSQGAEIELLHVHHVPLHGSDVKAPKTVEDLPEALRKDLGGRIALWQEQVDLAGVTLRTSLAVGTPHEAIVAAAKRTGADLIVMGTEGHSGLARMLIGSVTDRVLRTSDRPVLTVRRK